MSGACCSFGGSEGSSNLPSSHVPPVMLYWKFPAQSHGARMMQVAQDRILGHIQELVLCAETFRGISLHPSTVNELTSPLGSLLQHGVLSVKVLLLLHRNIARGRHLVSTWIPSAQSWVHQQQRPLCCYSREEKCQKRGIIFDKNGLLCFCLPTCVINDTCNTKLASLAS